MAVSSSITEIVAHGALARLLCGLPGIGEAGTGGLRWGFGVGGGTGYTPLMGRVI